MLKRIINFFLTINERKTNAELLKDEVTKREWLEYSVEKCKKYENLYPNGQLKCEKISITFGEDVFNLLEPGGINMYDDDFKCIAFYFNNWLYIERSNCFLGKLEITKLKDECKISQFYYFNWGDKELFIDILKIIIYSNIEKDKLNIKSYPLIEQVNIEKGILNITWALDYQL